MIEVAFSVSVIRCGGNSGGWEVSGGGVLESSLGVWVDESATFGRSGMAFRMSETNCEGPGGFWSVGGIGWLSVAGLVLL